MPEIVVTIGPVRYTRPNPLQEDGRFKRLLPGENISQAEITHRVAAWRRARFAAKLENYVPRRPRLYRDRVWLESYTLTAQSINRSAVICKPLGEFSHPFVVRVIGILRQNMAKEHKVNHKLAGAIDAWLDAVGC